MADPPEPTVPRRYRLPNRMRLKTAGQFRAVYDRGMSTAGGPLVIYARPNALDHPRLGLSVSRRVGRAVTRNRIKRLLRESFRLHQHDLPCGYDLVVNVRPHTPLPLTEYRRVWTKALEALHRRWTRRAVNSRATTDA